MMACTYACARRCRYMANVFVLPKDEADALWVPPTTFPLPEDDPMQAYWGGVVAVFGGKGDGCVDCRRGKLIDLAVDVTRTLR